MTSKPYTLVLKPGDVVQFYSATTGKLKWHLCLTPQTQDRCPRFLFINSRNKSEHDAILDNSCFPKLPPTEDKKSKVSFSMILPVGMDQLEKFEADVKGSIDRKTAEILIRHAESLVEPPLSGAEIRFIKMALGQIN